MTRLTVVIPVRDRPQFALRLLMHAGKQKMPYKFLIADSSGTYLYSVPDLDVNCVTFGNDRTFYDYYAKMDDTLAKVTTPYVMQADDDDFLSMSGIERALDFLDTNPDYVSAAGRVAGFSVHGTPLKGKLNRRYMYYDADDLSQDNAAERIRKGGLQLWVYYAVHRTPAMQTIVREVREINFHDLLLHEAFWVMRSLSLGKAHLDGRCISYFRQFGTSTHADKGRKSNGIDHAECLAMQMQLPDDIDLDNAVVEAVARKYKQIRQANTAPVQKLKWAVKDRFPAFAQQWRDRYRPLAYWEWQQAMRQLSDAGAINSEITTADLEMEQVRAAVA